jgi:hypothetical protein
MWHVEINSSIYRLHQPNGMDRSCVATIYPVLDKPRTTGGGLSRQEKDRGSFKIAFVFYVGRNA